MAQTVQSGTTLDQLPPALGLNGSELFWIYQEGPTEATPYIGLSCTTNQIVAYALGQQSTVTMRQLLAALARQGLLVEVYEALPSDVSNQYNIAYNHANVISIGDPFITGFVQPTLGYTNAQMQALFASIAAMGVGTGAVTMRQLLAAIAAESDLVTLYQALPSDITNQYNIAWYHAYYMTTSDNFITGFVQPTLGLTNAQVQALFVYASSFPA